MKIRRVGSSVVLDEELVRVADANLSMLKYAGGSDLFTVMLAIPGVTVRGSDLGAVQGVNWVRFAAKSQSLFGSAGAISRMDATAWDVSNINVANLPDILTGGDVSRAGLSRSIGIHTTSRIELISSIPTSARSSTTAAIMAVYRQSNSEAANVASGIIINSIISKAYDGSALSAAKTALSELGQGGNAEEVGDALHDIIMGLSEAHPDGLLYRIDGEWKFGSPEVHTAKMAIEISEDPDEMKALLQGMLRDFELSETDFPDVGRLMTELGFTASEEFLSMQKFIANEIRFTNLLSNTRSKLGVLISTPPAAPPLEPLPRLDVPEAPRVEAPETPEAPRVETPEAPRVETPEAPEPPRVEAPEPPRVEAPEPPRVEAPAYVDWVGALDENSFLPLEYRPTWASMLPAETITKYGAMYRLVIGGLEGPVRKFVGAINSTDLEYADRVLGVSTAAAEVTEALGRFPNTVVSLDFALAARLDAYIEAQSMFRYYGLEMSDFGLSTERALLFAIHNDSVSGLEAGAFTESFNEASGLMPFTLDANGVSPWREAYARLLDGATQESRLDLSERLEGVMLPDGSTRRFPELDPMFTAEEADIALRAIGTEKELTLFGPKVMRREPPRESLPVEVEVDLAPVRVSSDQTDDRFIGWMRELETPNQDEMLDKYFVFHDVRFGETVFYIETLEEGTFAQRLMPNGSQLLVQVKGISATGPEGAGTISLKYYAKIAGSDMVHAVYPSRALMSTRESMVISLRSDDGLFPGSSWSGPFRLEEALVQVSSSSITEDVATPTLIPINMLLESRALNIGAVRGLLGEAEFPTYSSPGMQGIATLIKEDDSGYLLRSGNSFLLFKTEDDLLGWNVYDNVVSESGIDLFGGIRIGRDNEGLYIMDGPTNERLLLSGDESASVDGIFAPRPEGERPIRSFVGQTEGYDGASNGYSGERIYLKDVEYLDDSDDLFMSGFVSTIRGEAGENLAGGDDVLARVYINAAKEFLNPERNSDFPALKVWLEVGESSPDRYLEASTAVLNGRTAELGSIGVRPRDGFWSEQASLPGSPDRAHFRVDDTVRYYDPGNASPEDYTLGIVTNAAAGGIDGLRIRLDLPGGPIVDVADLSTVRHAYDADDIMVPVSPQEEQSGLRALGLDEDLHITNDEYISLGGEWRITPEGHFDSHALTYPGSSAKLITIRPNLRSLALDDSVNAVNLEKAIELFTNNGELGNYIGYHVSKSMIPVFYGVRVLGGSADSIDLSRPFRVAHAGEPGIITARSEQMMVSVPGNYAYHYRRGIEIVQQELVNGDILDADVGEVRVFIDLYRPRTNGDERLRIRDDRSVASSLDQVAMTSRHLRDGEDAPARVISLRPAESLIAHAAMNNGIKLRHLDLDTQRSIFTQVRAQEAVISQDDLRIELMRRHNGNSSEADTHFQRLIIREEHATDVAMVDGIQFIDGPSQGKTHRVARALWLNKPTGDGIRVRIPLSSARFNDDLALATQAESPIIPSSRITSGVDNYVRVIADDRVADTLLSGRYSRDIDGPPTGDISEFRGTIDDLGHVSIDGTRVMLEDIPAFVRRVDGDYAYLVIDPAWTRGLEMEHMPWGGILDEAYEAKHQRYEAVHGDIIWILERLYPGADVDLQNSSEGVFYLNVNKSLITKTVEDAEISLRVRPGAASEVDIGLHWQAKYIFRAIDALKSSRAKQYIPEVSDLLDDLSDSIRAWIRDSIPADDGFEGGEAALRMAIEDRVKSISINRNGQVSRISIPGRPDEAGGRLIEFDLELVHGAQAVSISNIKVNGANFSPRISMSQLDHLREFDNPNMRGVPRHHSTNLERSFGDLGNFQSIAIPLSNSPGNQMSISTNGVGGIYIYEFHEVPEAISSGVVTEPRLLMAETILGRSGFVRSGRAGLESITMRGDIIKYSGSKSYENIDSLFLVNENHVISYWLQGSRPGSGSANTPIYYLSGLDGVHGDASSPGHLSEMHIFNTEGSPLGSHHGEGVQQRIAWESDGRMSEGTYSLTHREAGTAPTEYALPREAVSGGNLDDIYRGINGRAAPVADDIKVWTPEVGISPWEHTHGFITRIDDGRDGNRVVTFKRPMQPRELWRHGYPDWDIHSEHRVLESELLHRGSIPMDDFLAGLETGYSQQGIPALNDLYYRKIRDAMMRSESIVGHEDSLRYIVRSGDLVDAGGPDVSSRLDISDFPFQSIGGKSYLSIADSYQSLYSDTLLRLGLLVRFRNEKLATAESKIQHVAGLCQLLLNERIQGPTVHALEYDLPDYLRRLHPTNPQITRTMENGLVIEVPHDAVRMDASGAAPWSTQHQAVWEMSYGAAGFRADLESIGWSPRDNNYGKTFSNEFRIITSYINRRFGGAGHGELSPDKRAAMLSMFDMGEVEEGTNSLRSHSVGDTDFVPAMFRTDVEDSGPSYMLSYDGTLGGDSGIGSYSPNRDIQANLEELALLARQIDGMLIQNEQASMWRALKERFLHRSYDIDWHKAQIHASGSDSSVADQHRLAIDFILEGGGVNETVLRAIMDDYARAVGAANDAISEQARMNLEFHSDGIVPNRQEVGPNGNVVTPPGRSPTSSGDAGGVGSIAARASNYAGDLADRIHNLQGGPKDGVYPSESGPAAALRRWTIGYGGGFSKTNSGDFIPMPRATPIPSKFPWIDPSLTIGNVNWNRTSTGFTRLAKQTFSILYNVVVNSVANTIGRQMRITSPLNMFDSGADAGPLRASGRPDKPRRPARIGSESASDYEARLRTWDRRYQAWRRDSASDGGYTYFRRAGAAAAAICLADFILHGIQYGLGSWMADGFINLDYQDRLDRYNEEKGVWDNLLHPAQQRTQEPQPPESPDGMNQDSTRIQLLTWLSGKNLHNLFPDHSDLPIDEGGVEAFITKWADRVQDMPFCFADYALVGRQHAREEGLRAVQRGAARDPGYHQHLEAIVLRFIRKGMSTEYGGLCENEEACFLAWACMGMATLEGEACGLDPSALTQVFFIASGLNERYQEHAPRTREYEWHQHGYSSGTPNSDEIAAFISNVIINDQMGTVRTNVGLSEYYSGLEGKDGFEEVEETINIMFPEVNAESLSSQKHLSEEAISTVERLREHYNTDQPALTSTQLSAFDDAIKEAAEEIEDLNSDYRSASEAYGGIAPTFGKANDDLTFVSQTGNRINTWLTFAPMGEPMAEAFGFGLPLVDTPTFTREVLFNLGLSEEFEAWRAEGGYNSDGTISADSASDIPQDRGTDQNSVIPDRGSGQ